MDTLEVVAQQRLTPEQLMATWLCEGLAWPGTPARAKGACSPYSAAAKQELHGQKYWVNHPAITPLCYLGENPAHHTQMNICQEHIWMLKWYFDDFRVVSQAFCWSFVKVKVTYVSV